MCDSLGGKKKRKACENNETDEWNATKERIQKLLGLVGAARYYNLPSLVMNIQKTLSECCDIIPSLSLVVMDACQKEGPSLPSEFEELAWSYVRTKHGALKDPKSIACVDADLLEEILKDEKMEMDEYHLFDFLNHWVQLDPTKDRKSIAKDLAGNLHLEKVSPVHLSTSVASSGLFLPDQINETYKKQALATQQYNALSFQRSRKSFVWRKSLTARFGSNSKNIIDTLDCHPIKEGIHEWAVQVLDKFSYMRPTAILGIVCSETFIDNGSRLGSQKGSWGVEDSGCGYSEGEIVQGSSNPSEIQKGKEVILTLNLSHNDEQNGTLSVRYIVPTYYGAPKHNFVHLRLCTNLREHLKSHPGGFLPAVSACSGACMKFLRMRKLEEKI